MKRVLHFTPGFRYGGIESLLMGLHQQLDLSRFQFDIITDNLIDQPEFQKIRHSGGLIHQFDGFKRRPISYLRKFSHILNDYDRDTTTLHVHDPIRGMPLLRIAKAMSFHNRVVHSHNDSLDGTRFPVLSRRVVKLSNVFANRHIACSENAGRYLFGDIPFSVFKNPIDIDAYQFDQNKRERIRNDLGLPNTSLVVGHTGRFSYQKNHDWMVQVFSDFLKSEPEAILLLVGEGELQSHIKRLCKEYGVFDQICFAGSQSDISSYLSAMDVFFMPSHFEGLGISLIEAQASGLPCLVSDVFPKEAFATNSVTSLNLGQPLSIWSSALAKIAKLTRFDSKKSIHALRDGGFDVRLEWKTLLNLYGYRV